MILVYDHHQIVIIKDFEEIKLTTISKNLNCNYSCENTIG